VLSEYQCKLNFFSGHASFSHDPTIQTLHKKVSKLERYRKWGIGLPKEKTKKGFEEVKLKVELLRREEGGPESFRDE
jgi:hypothetical protein